MRGISNFRIHGQVYHLIGSLLPESGHPPMFAQLYIYDTEHENENRHSIMRDLNDNTLLCLQNMLDECNPYVKNFRQARDIIMSNTTSEISMLIHNDRTHDPHRYNPSVSSDIATIMVGDGYNIEPTNRDICLRLRNGGLQRISRPIHHMIHYIMYFYFPEAMMAGI